MPEVPVVPGFVPPAPGREEHEHRWDWSTEKLGVIQCEKLGCFALMTSAGGRAWTRERVLEPTFKEAEEELRRRLGTVIMQMLREYGLHVTIVDYDCKMVREP